MSAYLFFFFVFLVGIIFGGVLILYRATFGGGFPDLSWWQWILTPLAIGLYVVISPTVFEAFQKKTGFGVEGQSESKRIAHLVILFLILAIIIIGPGLYRIANP